MSAAGPMQKRDAPARASPELQGVALGHRPRAGSDSERLWIRAGGSHRIFCGDDARKARLLAAVLELKPEAGATLVVLGADVAALGGAARRALRERIGYLPPAGGLLSALNGWENIALPLAFHRPERARDIAARARPLIAGLGAEPRALFARLPEEMTLYEKKLAGFVRILLEAPALVLADDLMGGLDNREREYASKFAAAFHQACPGGTFVALENMLEA